MRAVSRKAHLTGTVDIPASKSHTVRALVLGALGDGTSVIHAPLVSFDTLSCLDAVTALGARIERFDDHWTVEGTAGKPHVPDDVIDVGNSGTTLYMVMGATALGDGTTVITGDSQIRRRTASALIGSLNDLGADVRSTRNNGCAPVIVTGPMTGGETSVEAVTSQYLSSLLLACPCAAGDTTVTVTRLNERPYVEMTLAWLDHLGVQVMYPADMTSFTIPGGQRYPSFDRRIPGDFSTATFMLCAGAVAGGTVVVRGLSMDDPQGDRAVVDILLTMGADISARDDAVVVTGGSLKGGEIDMNAIPDAIPMLAVTACFAEGTTVLGNVPQARVKETDRLAVMAAELTKLGAVIEELPDGLVVHGGGLRGGEVAGHGDHRVVMALAIAGCAADGPVIVDTAEAAGVTYPGFWDDMAVLGADISLLDTD